MQHHYSQTAYKHTYTQTHKRTYPSMHKHTSKGAKTRWMEDIVSKLYKKKNSNKFDPLNVFDGMDSQEYRQSVFHLNWEQRNPFTDSYRIRN